MVQIYSFFNYLQVILKFFLNLLSRLADEIMIIDFKNLNLSNLLPENDFENKVKNFSEEWFSDSKMVKVQTSGSTGVPKVFEIEKEKMLHSAKMTCDFLSLKTGDKALICLPIEYISGKMMVVRSIERNLQLIVENPSLIIISKFEYSCKRIDSTVLFRSLPAFRQTTIIEKNGSLFIYNIFSYQRNKYNSYYSPMQLTIYINKMRVSLNNQTYYNIILEY